MRIQKPGMIDDRLLFLGNRHICSYLVMGDQFALIGGGVAWEVQRLESQFQEFKVDTDRIRYLVISHAHHDHCGAVPYLLRKYPHIQPVSSAYCAYVLNKDKPVDLITKVNKTTLDALKRPHAFEGIPIDFSPIPIAVEVGDGDQLDLGRGLSLQFYMTPGHSRCSLSVYIPELEALFPADSIPAPETGKRELTVTANHDYDAYLHSLEKLEPLSIRLVCYEHGGVLTGEDAAEIIPRGLEATRLQRSRIQKRFEELQDFDLLVGEVSDKYQQLELFRLVPAGLMRAITERMIKSALGWV